MGGLLTRMPRTGVLMIVGAGAIAALPPLNGFVSEWLIYECLARGGLATPGAAGIAVLLGIGALAFIGCLAAFCFVRLAGISLLGEPRSEAARWAKESSPWLWGSMSLLAGACVLIALFPAFLVSAMSRTAAEIMGSPTALDVPAALRPLRLLATCNASLWLLLGGAGVFLFLLTRRRGAPDQTWGCGYPARTARMQYTARSFSEILAERLVPSALGPRIRTVTPKGLFPATGKFAAECVDPFTRSIYDPLFDRSSSRFARLRWLQQGHLPIYILYILLVIVLALGWMSVRSWLGA